jgi:hypothetical protein
MSLHLAGISAEVAATVPTLLVAVQGSDSSSSAALSVGVVLGLLYLAFVLFAIWSTIWVGIDAGNIRKRSDGLETPNPVLWVLAFIGIWIVAFPLYLYRRPMFLASAEANRRPAKPRLPPIDLERPRSHSSPKSDASSVQASVIGPGDYVTIHGRSATVTHAKRSGALVRFVLSDGRTPSVSSAALIERVSAPPPETSQSESVQVADIPAPMSSASSEPPVDPIGTSQTIRQLEF